MGDISVSLGRAAWSLWLVTKLLPLTFHLRLWHDVSALQTVFFMRKDSALTYRFVQNIHTA